MKMYYVETWNDSKEIAVFDNEQERMDWIKTNFSEKD